MTANILAHNDDLDGARAYFEELKAIEPDALIISDPGMFTIAREVCPEIDIHVSIPGKQCQLYDISFLAASGCNPCGNGTGTLLEGDSGDPGSYSGQPGDRDICTWSYVYLLFRKMSSEQFLYRKRCEPGSLYTSVPAGKYSVVEETRPGEYMPVYENERGTYIFNSKDLCMVDHLPDLVDAGVDSLKIGGTYEDGTLCCDSCENLPQGTG